MKEKRKVIKKKIAKTKATAKKVVKKVVKRGTAKQYTFKPLVRTLKLLDVSAAELARRLSCNQSFLSKWLYELNYVPLRFATKIEELTAGKIKAKVISPTLYAIQAKKAKVLAKALARDQKKAA